jgi:signal transduction histidine kinase
MESVIALARHARGASRVQFESRVRGALPEVHCDSEQIKQVLLNLVMNAVEATPEGTVCLEASAQSDFAVITVQDEGSGVPVAQEDLIFEPFFTTKESGNGLGLAIAAQIVDQHGGNLAARNRPGKGLTIELRLPVRSSMKAGA